MGKAIQVTDFGGPEVLRCVDVTVGEPGADEIRVRHTAIGLNFIDVYFRTGVYRGPDLPFIPGMEAVGVVEAVGSGVSELKEGDRVAYATPPLGAYAEVRLMPADRVVKAPDGLPDDQLAGMMLKGMTAEYLLRRVYDVQAGDTILFQAAAGGVGLIACQWAKHLGAIVIGTVGSEEKAALATAHGCDHTILYREENVVERVREITDGKGVRAVYDGVGKDTFDISLDCLQTRGLMVSFGQSSGLVPSFDPGILSAKGSLYLTRPTLMTYNAERADLVASAKSLFGVVESGAVKIEVQQSFALEDAADAHRALEGRQTTGSTVLLP